MTNSVQQPFLCPCSLCAERRRKTNNMPLAAALRLVPRREADVCDTLSVEPESCRYEE